MIQSCAHSLWMKLHIPIFFQKNPQGVTLFKGDSSDEALWRISTGRRHHLLYYSDQASKCMFVCLNVGPGFGDLTIDLEKLSQNFTVWVFLP